MYLFLLVLSSLAGCAPSQADLSRHALPNGATPSVAFVKNITYDQHGLPLFQPLLSCRPSKAGEQYTLVYFVNNRPVKSFDIVMLKQKIDLDRPLNVLYTWSGKGFEVGVVLGHMTISSGGGSGRKEGLVVLAVGAAMPLVGGIAGFVIGTLAIIPQGVQDLGELLSGDSEAIINFTEYEYDAYGRLKTMKMFQPGDAPTELVRTVLTYEKNETVPSKTEVYSAPENKTRKIP